MKKNKYVAMIGTLDTKGDQLEYLKELIEKRGLQLITLDTSVMGNAPFKPTVDKHQIAKEAGTTIDELIALGNERQAMIKMGEGAAKIANEFYSKNKLHGILAVGGSMGTDVAVEVMKALPLGIPKMILSTVAHSRAITPEMVDSDIIMLPWFAGLWGLNSLVKQMLNTTAGAIAGAVEEYDQELEKEPKKVVAITSLGQTVCRYVGFLKPALEERGYEVAVFHATGMSGRLLERAISDGKVDAVLDMAVGVEIANEIVGGVCTAGKNRLEAAAKKGIPQIVCPGPVEIFHWGETLPLPERFEGRDQRPHNRILTELPTTIEEKAAAGEFMANKLNLAVGPTKVVIPMKGYRLAHSAEMISALSEEEIKELNEVMKNMLFPEEGKKAFKDEFVKNIKNDNVEVIILEDDGLNDPEFAEKVLSIFDELMSSDKKAV